MKKLISILLVLTLFISVTACGSKTDDSAEPSAEASAVNEHSSSVDAPQEAEPADEAAEAYKDKNITTEHDILLTRSTAALEDYREIPSSSESYLTIDENQEKYVEKESTLTFSLKVDTAAYTNVARMIEGGTLPPADAVRTEELINYFNYDTPMEFGDNPFAVYTEIGPSPLDSNKYMVFARVKTEEIEKENLPSSNLTFLIDTSGSMFSHDKLPLLKEAFALLVETLDKDDMVSIVTYAGSSSVVLNSVGGDNKMEIISAINNLEASGSTAGADGILTAYELAEKNFIKGGNNRVILASDGDFNVGISSVEELSKLIAKKRDSGTYLSILGFGTGNIRDDIMETLAKDGNGNYSYINSISTANKVLVEELGSNLFTVADDVKAQVEFNPDNVKSYRLIGYENRALNNEDFEDDTKDAGEIGVGTDVVIMFEIELNDGNNTDTTKYGDKTKESSSSDEFSNELFEIRIRYKDPGKSTSKLIEVPVMVSDIKKTNSTDFNFASSIAAFGHLLRNSEYLGDATFESVYQLALKNTGKDTGKYREKHIELLKEYAQLVD